MIEDIILKLRTFAEDRDWNQFHSPKNLTMALAGEIGELIEIFQWLKEEESEKSMLDKKQIESIEQEVADIFLYLLRLTDKLEIDIIDAATKKLEINAKKYPINLSKGNSKKYRDL
jgi:dCTP diphosphatase